jgi:hypothetical protein
MIDRSQSPEPVVVQKRTKLRDVVAEKSRVSQSVIISSMNGTKT